MTGVSLDGTNYDVKVVYKSLQRAFSIVSGQNQGTNLIGGDIADVLGTKYAYTLQVEPNPSNPTAYDSFYQKVSEPVAEHVVSFPYGQTILSFNAKIVAGTDTYNGKLGTYERWGNLTITFIATTPQRLA